MARQGSCIRMNMLRMSYLEDHEKICNNAVALFLSRAPPTTSFTASASLARSFPPFPVF